MGKVKKLAVTIKKRNNDVEAKYPFPFLLSWGHCRNTSEIYGRSAREISMPFTIIYSTTGIFFFIKFKIY